VVVVVVGTGVVDVVDVVLELGEVVVDPARMGSVPSGTSAVPMPMRA
jgi:hypothetical protein